MENNDIKTSFLHTVRHIIHIKHNSLSDNEFITLKRQTSISQTCFNARHQDRQDAYTDKK